MRASEFVLAAGAADEGVVGGAMLSASSEAFKSFEFLVVLSLLVSSVCLGGIAKYSELDRDAVAPPAATKRAADMVEKRKGRLSVDNGDGDGCVARDDNLKVALVALVVNNL